jgi:hypothetical protein
MGPEKRRGAIRTVDTWPKNPLWYNGTNEEVQNTGHADVFEDSEGYWWAVSI